MRFTLGSASFRSRQRSTARRTPKTAPHDQAVSPQISHNSCGGTAVATVAITGNNLDPGTCAAPRFHSGGLPVGQQIDDLPPFEIADQRAILQSLTPRPVVDTHHAGGAAIAPSVFARTLRRNVSLLTGSKSRRASACAGRPTRAMPM